MSKALSANIHDPNHTVDEYDLYFNGEAIETGGGSGLTWIVKTVKTTATDILTIALDEALPEVFHVVGYGLYGGYKENNIIAFSNENDGNSHGLVMANINTSTSTANMSLMGFKFAISEDRKSLIVQAAAPNKTFIVNLNYVIFIAY